MGFFSRLADGLREKKAQGRRAKIVLPEGSDSRIVGAAIKLKQEGLIEPILLGKKSLVQKIATNRAKSAYGIHIIEPALSPLKEELLEKLLERRNGKLSREEGEKLIEDENYFGTMLVYTGKVDGMISGAIHSTADTVRPALQIIKTKPGVKAVSGLIILVRDEEAYFLADCGINIAPTDEELADIAISTYHNVKSFGYDPEVAMLSFSTKGSAKSDEVTKMQNATKLALEKEPGIPLDGELQFDAAFVPEVAMLKAPGSKIAGNANTFIFPSLEAGNIAYKITQRLGHFKAAGPVLQGLNAPINDLSRGCVTQEVYDLALITATQALYGEQANF